jgi:hypothetical protein
MQTPIEKVKQDTISQIEKMGYADTLNKLGLSETIDIINRDIRQTENNAKNN